MITGILIALPEELTTLTSKKIGKGRGVFISDTLLIACSGAGPQNAQSAAQHLINQGATRLLSWGCAAGLSASVKPGDLIVADRLIDADHNEIASTPEWHRGCLHILQQLPGEKSVRIHTGAIAESRRMISSSEDKKQLHSQTGAVALDMESAAIARVARLHQMDFLALRAIADPATMDLPKAIEYSLNDQGDIRLDKLLLFLILHPLELPGLIQLGLHFNKAKLTLKRVASQLQSITGFGDLISMETI
ncbi:MAG: phosphorylase family protein [Methylosarcina sp.]